MVQETADAPEKASRRVIDKKTLRQRENTTNGHSVQTREKILGEMEERTIPQNVSVVNHVALFVSHRFDELD